MQGPEPPGGGPAGGPCQALLQEMKGFHWMMSYGNYLRETGYALKKLNVDLHDVSAAKA